MDVGDGTTSGELSPALAMRAGYVLRRAATQCRLMLDELPPGVDMHAFAALLTLASGVVRSQQSIGEIIGLSRTAVGQIAADLADQGLVTRVRNPEDRRSYALTRTLEGDNAVRRLGRQIEEVDDRLTAPFNVVEREELRLLLVRAAANKVAPDTPVALLENVGFLVTRLHFWAHRGFATAIAPLEVEPRHVGCLTVLAETGPTPQAQLARALGVSGANVVEMVDGMESRGLVERRRVEIDRRVQLVHLLPRATEVAVDAYALGEAVISDLLAPLDAAERRRLVAYLIRLIAAP